MAGEEEACHHGGMAEREDDLLLPELLRSLSFGSAGAVSFRSSSASAGDFSWRSYVASSTEMEFDDEDGIYRTMQSEVEEIPSFRWISTPLRWWRTRRTSCAFESPGRVSLRSSKASAAAGDFVDGDVTYGWMQLGQEGIPESLPHIGKRTDLSEKNGSPGGKARPQMRHFHDYWPPALPAFKFDNLKLVKTETSGKSSGYGTANRAVRKNRSQVAVKRLRGEITRVYEAEVTMVGKIRHPNLLALRAYCFAQDEMVLVFDYMPKGNLSAFLHGRGPDIPADWQTRMFVALGITRGLHHLHTRENMVHGNLTSGSILLDDHNNAKIADYGLSRVTSAAASAGALAYRAPELSKQEAANTKSDVYSLGIVLLELWTGKSPGEAVDGLDMPQWAAMMVKEGSNLEVFDEELREGRADGCFFLRRADDMLYALGVALHCVHPSPDARPDVGQVLHQLSEIYGIMETWEWRKRDLF